MSFVHSIVLALVVLQVALVFAKPRYEYADNLLSMDDDETFFKRAAGKTAQTKSKKKNFVTVKYQFSGLD